MEFYRNQTKHDQILNKLHEFITTEYAIYPNFGIVEFFEFVVTNPYNEAQLITIIIDDPEVQVVTDSREWRHLKLLHQIYSQVEDNMFHRQEIDANKADVKHQQIYLRPKETINIPLKYQTFKANNAVEIDERVGRYNDQPLVRHMPPKYDIKKINVMFRAQDNNPISILRLIVDQQPHVVNQTFRFSEAEHSFLKKTIRLPSSVRALASNSTAVLSGDIKIDGTATDQAVSQIYVRCSDPNVVCESRPVTVGEPHDVFFKVKSNKDISELDFLQLNGQITHLYI
jgi:nephrocystin-4